jgi:hypothetical protein
MAGQRPRADQQSCGMQRHDFSPYPKGGCLNFANIKADPFYTRHKSSDERATLSLAAKN